MSDRDLLGPADIDDQTLSAMVARLLGEPTAEVTEIEVTPVDYDLPAITTAARHWVSGSARTTHGVRRFRMFVKQVRCWSRSPMFQDVPPDVREFAAASVPWRTEALVYRSELADHLPDGLEMPRALGVFDLPDRAAAIWLPEVPIRPAQWNLARYERAAYLLGRLAGSARVAPYAGVGAHSWTLDDYVGGRVTHQIVPMLHDDRLWSHPVAESYPPGLRARMQQVAARAPELAAELAAAPYGNAHGDACPNNLLAGPTPDSFVLIDFGFWMALPLGFDLGQLQLGELQLGRRGVEELVADDPRLVQAYRRGLADEGVHVTTAALTRWHAIQMTLFGALSSLPVEHLAGGPTPALFELAESRARMTEFCLDLLDAG